MSVVLKKSQPHSRFVMLISINQQGENWDTNRWCTFQEQSFEIQADRKNASSELVEENKDMHEEMKLTLLKEVSLYTWEQQNKNEQINK